MRDIICLFPTAQSAAGDEYLKQLVESAGYNYLPGQYSDSVEYIHAPLILMADSTTLPSLLEVLSKREQKTIIALNTRKDFKMVGELKSSLNGILDLLI